MKVLHNTDAFIEGKLYKEGSSIPKKYEEEFKEYLIDVELPESKTKLNAEHDNPGSKDSKKNNK